MKASGLNLARGTPVSSAVDGGYLATSRAGKGEAVGNETDHISLTGQ